MGWSNFFSLLYLKFYILSRCANFHANFPSGSIVLYNQEKFLCKISFKPTYRMIGRKLYIRNKEIKETHKEFTLIPNFNHSMLFKVKESTWQTIREECHQRNAGFYFFPNKGTLEGLAYLFGGGYFHVGLHLKGETWVTDAGIEATSLFWGASEPNGNGNENCAAVTPEKFMVDLVCDDLEFSGICIQ